MPETPSQGTSTQRERESVAAALREAAELAGSPAFSPPPANSIPGYTIVREIGRGGMGVIYEAQQKEPARAVALKVMRGGGTVNKQRLKLFRQEVQTLARLNNPSIAPIYEVGCTEDGQQFFAMELVRGVPLGDYVRLQQLPLREQLQLFRRVCEAVHYAHQRGVIHRDLKPSNLLVDSAGHPKVLDFGLARITDADETMRTMFAEAGKIMGTLPYMSPEQAYGRSDEIDVRSDVYSLGVILYELLTEQLPYDLAEAGRDEAQRIIREELPHKPSTISRSLRGDLELIVLKALEKDRARRYQSAAALGDDLNRLLAGQPVLAHPPSSAYQFRKFVGRHKVLVGFVVALIVLVTGFGIEMRSLHAEADAARSVAQVRAFHAQYVQRRLADRLQELAELYRERSDHEAAQARWRECLSIRRNTHGDDHWLTAHTASLLGGCLTALGRYSAAEPLLLDSYPIIRAQRGEGRELTLEALHRIIDLYELWGKLDQAAEWRAKLPTTQPAATRPAGP